MAQQTYQQINLITDIELSWPFTFNGAIDVLDINNVNPNQNGWTIAMPDATLGQAGQLFRFNNISGFSFQLVANDLTTVLATLTAGQVVDIYLTDNSTTNGTWSVITPPAVNAITQITAQSTDSTITINNGTVNPPNGTINFRLPTSLSNFLKINSTSFPVIASTNPLTFNIVQMIAGTNITINDGTGLSGNVIFDLNSTISGIASMGVGSVVLTGTAIIVNNDTNGNIQLSTNGTGQVQMNGVSIDTSGNITGINNFVAPQAFWSFSDTLVGKNNVIVIGSQVNIASVTGSGGVYTINFTTPMANANYGVLLTLGSDGGVLPFVSNAYYITRTTTTVTIEITDASGSLVTSVPRGVTGMIMSK